MTGYAILGGQRRGLTANGLSPVVFRKVFKRDFLTERQEKRKDSGGLVELYGMMAFVMAMQHDRPQAEIFQLTQDDYYTFLAGLNGADIENNVETIHAIYEGNEVPTSDPKNEPA